MKTKKIKFLILSLLFLICFKISAQEKTDLQKQIKELEESENTEKSLKQALKLEKEYKNSQEYADILVLLGDLYYELAEYEESLNYTENALKLVEKTKGKQDTLYIQLCSDLAVAYADLGNHDKARELYKETLQIQLDQNKKETELYAETLTNFAMFESAINNYDIAIKSMKEAKSIYENLKLENTLEYVIFLQQLGRLNKLMGNTVEAQQIYENVLLQLESKVDKQDKDYLEAKSEYAIFVGEIGQIEKAITMLEEVIELQAANPNTNKVIYAVSLHDLASLYADLKNHKKAIPLYQKAIQLFEETTGKNSIDFIASNSFLANSYQEEGKLEDAEKLYLESYKLGKKTLGKTNPDVALWANDLGNFYLKQNQITKAKPYFEESYQIIKSELNPHHPYYIIALSGVALYYTKNKEIEKATKLYKEIVEIDIENIKNVFPILNENQKEGFISVLEVDFLDYQDFILQFYKEKPELIHRLFELNLLTKGLIFQSTQKLRQNITNSKDEEMIAAFENWKSKKNKLTSAWQLSQEEQKEKNINLPKLKEEAEKAEYTLINLAKQKGLAGTKSLDFLSKNYSFADVQKTLKENEAVIEIIRAERFNEQKKSYDTLYTAVIIEKNNLEPKLVVLENGKEMETSELVFYRNNIEFGLKESESYATFWEKINTELSPTTKKIYFSPDGVYHQININTLYDDKSENYLTDKFQVQMISSSRDLIEFYEAKEQNKNHLESQNQQFETNFADYQFYLFGYPQYNLIEKTEQNENSNQDGNNKKRSVFSSQRFWRNGGITPLLGTKEEVQTIDSLLGKSSYKTITFLEKEANESNLKKLVNPTVLHIATHGFFTPSDNQSKNNSPLTQSGLLLAGAENGIRENKNGTDEDGVLTAEEVLTFNLDKTELVILSACETGLGVLRNGEGVYGLERAFRQAGAKSVIISLWKVSDEATNKMMQYFYKHWIVTKDKHKAFELAQKELRKEFSQPFYWGAFVLVGE